MSTANLDFKLTNHLTTAELEAGLEEIRRAPKDEGVLELIVRRPAINTREVLEEAELHLEEGLVGDSWKKRRAKSTPDGSPNPLMQLNIMNSRVTALVAQDKDRWQLAGDQLYIDMDLSEEEHSGRHASGFGLGRFRSDAAASSWLSEVCSPLRHGSDEVCEFAARERTASSWRQR